jgi:hypothetical protein
LNQWNATAPPQSPVPNWVAWGAGTTINARGEGYYYGGYSTNLTTPGWSGPPWATNSLLMYDMINNFWTNNSGPDSIGRAEGVMVTIPASKQGLLVYFGGVTFPYENETEVAVSICLMSEPNACSDLCHSRPQCRISTFLTSRRANGICKAPVAMFLTLDASFVLVQLGLQISLHSMVSPRDDSFTLT